MQENRAVNVGENRVGSDAQHIPMLLGEREADGENEARFTRSSMGCGVSRARSWGRGVWRRDRVLA